MKCTKSIILLFFLGLFVVLAVLLRVISVSADTSDSLNTTVKISICGNGIIEGGEDCEGENLNGQTCESIGYGPGTLSCDIACSFDTSNCISPTPTLTPTPTSTPTPTPTPTEIPTTTSTVTSAPAATATAAPTILPSPTPKPALPTFLIPFDPDGDGTIHITEVFRAVKSWVDEWQQSIIDEIAATKGEVQKKKARTCDVNNDGVCNLKDLSILLFYIGK